MIRPVSAHTERKGEKETTKWKVTEQGSFSVFRGTPASFNWRLVTQPTQISILDLPKVAFFWGCDFG